MLGTLGQLLILVSFVACGLSGFAFLQAARHEGMEWLRIGRSAWGVVVTALLGASGILLYLLLTHQFQYAYVYEQSSLDQQTIFLFSAFWAGQQGSFLLWAVFMALLGIPLIRKTDTYEAPVMTVVAFCQVFLLSMVVGLKLGAFSLGASPFQTLAEKYPDAPILQTPGFVPADGSGLNDLLQNYWMAIHPPTLFIGFTMLIVPFAFSVAALWKRRYTEWVKPALPWTIAGVMVLGVGIMMGGYWAYETLSFGGYWAWDPVENSSLVPWLISVAAIHCMIIQRKSGRGHKAALFLNLLAFMLVIYSTFLTRSGILGDVSVHSFVDLGMMNQLLVWILAMAVVGFGLFAVRYRELPTPREEPHLLSREFMIFAGAMLLCAVAAVVTVGTSSPILGKMFREAPSTVPIDFYNRWTLPLAIGFVFLVGLGQLFWWNKMSLENANRVLLKPIALAVASTVAILVFTPFVELTMNTEALQAPAESVARAAGLLGGFGQFWAVYGTGLLLLLLVFVAFFALYGNGLVLWRISRGNPKLAGGALSHVGLAIMVLGIIASSGFSEPLARATGVQIGASRDNFILTRGETRTVGGYKVTYSGREPSAEGRPAYVLDFVDPAGRSYTLKPVVYKSNKDQWIQHPDHKILPEKDLFVAVTPSPMFGTEDTRPGELALARGDSTVLGDQEYAVRFRAFDTNVDRVLLPDSTEIAVAAVLDVTNLATGETRELRPVYIIMRDRMQQFIQARVPEWNLGMTFTGMNVENGRINLVVDGVEVTPEDWIVVQAYEKPFINFMWFGFLILTAGFGLSAYRRWQDVKMRARPA